MERGLEVRLLAAYTPLRKVRRYSIYWELKTERLLLRPLGAVSVALDETRREGERIYPKTGERAGEITCSRTF